MGDSQRRGRSAGWLTLALLWATATASEASIWLDPAELAARSTSGAAWDELLDTADSDIGSADLDDYGDRHDTNTLAKALVAARLGLHGAGASYRQDAADNIMTAIGTEGGDSVLPNARNTTAYVIAADLIDFRNLDSNAERTFRAWLTDLRFRCFDGRSMHEASMKRPNNWGLMSTAARLAIAIYLRDNGGPPPGTCNNFDSCNLSSAAQACSDPIGEIATVAQVFRGYLGDRAAYSGFNYGALDWQADPSEPVGINPMGSAIQGHDVDGVLPDEQRRGGGFTWPPPKEGYVYEGLQAAIVVATILEREGHSAWLWSDSALLRAFQWLHKSHFDDGTPYIAEGDDEWQPHLVNYRCGTSFPATTPARGGKLMAWTDWTHAASLTPPGASCSGGGPPGTTTTTLPTTTSTTAPPPPPPTTTTTTAPPPPPPTTTTTTAPPPPPPTTTTTTAPPPPPPTTTTTTTTVAPTTTTTTTTTLPPGTPICGDDFCAGAADGETCYSCASDCRCKGSGCSRACCGNGVCTRGENAGNCPIDCAVPTTTTTTTTLADGVPYCGDDVCGGAAAGETCFSCETDCRCKGKDCKRACCGNGVCTRGENADNCAADCG